MTFRGGFGSGKSTWQRRNARFVKGDLPDWIDQPGALMRATAFIVRRRDMSQVPGYDTVVVQTIEPLKDGKGRYSSSVIAKRGDFGLYLGKKHVPQKLAGDKNRTLTVPVPTFWFNGRRIVSGSLHSYDDMVVADDVYDDWLLQCNTRGR